MACSAGSSAKRMAVTAATANAKPMTRGSIRSSSASGNGQARLERRQAADQRGDDRDAERAGGQRQRRALRRAAASGSAPREAPTASRVATSRRRSSARASSIAATLLHAIKSTSTVSPPSIAMKPTTGPAIGAGTRADRATATPHRSRRLSLRSLEVRAHDAVQLVARLRRRDAGRKPPDGRHPHRAVMIEQRFVRPDRRVHRHRDPEIGAQRTSSR